MHSLPGISTLIHDLVAIPSVSSSDLAWDMGNRAALEVLGDWLHGIGFAVSFQDIAPDKANLVAVLGSGTGGLVLAGHMDTVPYDDTRWNSDPFRVTQRDGRLYGLGTTDMKSFLAMAVHVAAEIDARELKKPLIILATADEETSMAGARALTADRLQHADCAVIGEPTGLKPVIMHKGMMTERIRIIGQSGHSSDPSLGRNAMEGMHQYLAELMAWRSKLRETHQHPAFTVPYPTVNLGRIHGGDNPNRICGECVLDIDCRPLPGMSLGELREQLQALGSSVDDGLQIEFETLFDGIPAMQTAPDSDIVAIATRLTGAEPTAVAFGTEAPFLNKLGIATVVLGPGDIDQAHQPDEYLALDRINPMLDILRKLIKITCL